MFMMIMIMIIMTVINDYVDELCLHDNDDDDREEDKDYQDEDEDDQVDDDHHKDEYDDDLLSLSMSLPSSFACFNFLSIALLIFCNAIRCQTGTSVN